jgi:hypothetical protein
MSRVIDKIIHLAILLLTGGTMKKIEFEITKSQAITILGYDKKRDKVTMTEAAKKMEISRAALSAWSEQLTGDNKDRVLSAIFRWNLRGRYKDVLAGGCGIRRHECPKA